MILLALALACAAESTARDSGEPQDTAAPVDDTPYAVMIPPYLQRTGPDSMTVLWETEAGEESTVEYGLTDALGTTATGVVDTEGTGLLHVVELPDLLPDTRYHYRVRTGGTVSETLSFRTPPPPGTPFQLVAASDMQRDDSHPDQWEAIVSQGILPFVAENYGSEPDQALGALLLTGDLVDNGWLYSDWYDDFFQGAAPLMGQVPLLAVPGNHEANSPLFWRYFEQPDNGSPGYEGHWWWLDHGSARIIGLDSNGSYADQQQLDWLAEVLDASCADPDIALVFAQLHHPAKSELWVDGEKDWSMSVVELLDAFTETCGKPAVHFFGHTHGYSRGQSRDHRHLWVNVAVAGGAIDRWSDSAVDYDEFSVSQAEYGFVAVEVGTDAFTLRRVSMGTPEDPRDREITDEVTVPFAPQAPDQPTLSVEADALQASTFSGVGELGASQWQLSADCEGFSDPVVDRWEQHENWFWEEDLQAGVDLSRLALDELPTGSWCARVRYRDRGLAWSEWSEGAVLTLP